MNAADLAAAIRRAHQALIDNEHAWPDLVMALAEQLRIARDECGSNDSAFGEWLREHECGGELISAHDRMALLGMADHPVVARQQLEVTSRRSLQHIWRQEIQPQVRPDRLLSADNRPAPFEALTVSQDERAAAAAAAAREQQRLRAAFEAEKAAAPDAQPLREAREWFEAAIAAGDQETVDRVANIARLIEAERRSDPAETLREAVDEVVWAWRLCTPAQREPFVATLQDLLEE